MRYAITLPNIDYDAQVIADLAIDAEEAGWDGVFVWDCINMRNQSAHDPWMILAAIAARTQRIRLGTLITPLSRRRPWKVARETVTLDHLSDGRFILPVGLGETNDGGFSNVGEELDRKKRAQMLERKPGYPQRPVERRAVQLQWRILSYKGNDLLTKTGAIAAHPRLGGWRVAAREVHAADAALRWHSSGENERGWFIRRYDSRRSTRYENVHRRAAHPHHAL